MIRALTVALTLLASQAAAEPPRLSFPVDCTLGDSCFIQNYVDRDPGPEARDFACAGLTYDSHRGTDIALSDLATMRAGVTVRAAAPGTVRATRDGMPDILFTDPGAPDVSNRSCGNAVIVDHADGWQTRYCHLKQGSVPVRTGDGVTPGTPIGQVGLSGKTEFPHLHISVLHDGLVIDPFQPSAATCGTADTALWADPITYIAGGLVAAGFAAAIPDFDAIKSGTAQAEILPATAPALVIWAHVFGARQGDVLDLTITGDRGEFLNQTVLLNRTQARLFRATGRKRRTAAWPAGRYTGTATLIRNGAEIDRLTTSVEITN